MKRYLILYIIVTLLSVTPLWAQQSKYDRVRYDQMNEAGIWNVGISMEPVVGMSHPRFDGVPNRTTGIFGFMVEGGYFVMDNLRLSLALGFVNNEWGNFFSDPLEEISTQSHFKVKLGAHVHRGRWDVGARILLGNTTYKLFSPMPIDEWVPREELFRDRQTLVGLSYDLGYMVSPFFKVGGYFEPSLTSGGGYAYAVGARLTIFLPFINMVVCK